MGIGCELDFRRAARGGTLKKTEKTEMKQMEETGDAEYGRGIRYQSSRRDKEMQMGLGRGF